MPLVVLLFVVTVIVEVCPGVTDDGLNDAAIPAGRTPTIDNATAPLNPPLPATFTWYVAVSPGSIVFDGGVAESENDDATYGVTVRLTFVE